MNIYILIAKRFLSSVNDTGKFTSIISIVGICIGSFALVISISVLNGFENKLDEKISNFDGHLKILGLNQGYDLTKFRTIESITDLSFSSDRKGIIKSNTSEALITFKQLDFDKLKSFYNIPFVGDISDENKIVIGNDIAARLGLSIGDEVVISSPLDQNSIFSFPSRAKTYISAIFFSKILDYDNRYILISNSLGNKVFFNNSNLSSLDVKISDASKIEVVKAKVSNIVDKENKVHSWKEKNTVLVSAIKMEKLGSIIVLSLIIVVASFSVISTISLITMKKIKDIGILRLLGMELVNVKKIIIIQTIIIGLKGLFLGLFFGVTLVLLQNNYELITLPSEIYAMEVLPMYIAYEDILIVLIINILFIITAGLICAKKFLKTDPLEMLKWVK
ncbi:MAG: ABC transporter permease [Candidatus Neomarinimicrobiota bacterium]